MAKLGKVTPSSSSKSSSEDKPSSERESSLEREAQPKAQPEDQPKDQPETETTEQGPDIAAIIRSLISKSSLNSLGVNQYDGRLRGKHLASKEVDCVCGE